MSYSFTYKAGRTEAEQAEAVVKFVTPSELQKEKAVWVQPRIDQALRSAYAKGLFMGETGQTETIPTLGLADAEHIVFAGLSEEGGADELRLAAAAAAKALKQLKARQARVELGPGLGERFGAAAAGQALAEGMALALHEWLPLRREETRRYEPDAVDVVAAAGEPAEKAEAWTAGLARGSVFAEGVRYARDLTNMPGNELTPERLAAYAEELAHDYDLDVEIIDEWSAAEQGMGGLLAVGKGSVNEPRMIVLHYEGAPGESETWGLIGKGVTFDTGGISLKRGQGMEGMISDMGGAAAVLGAMRIIGELKPAVNIVAVIPAAENMPSHRSFKPGDIIRMMNGLTVEVINTDAEGRIVLADGMTTAIRRGATRLVDVATLTGAVLSALGDQVTGAVANDDALLGQVIAAGSKAGERIWAFPSHPEFRKQLRSDAADLKNGGGRYGGAITGGLFIGEFAGNLPWVHLDICGTAFIYKSRGWEPKGATGVMTRTLAELVIAP